MTSRRDKDREGFDIETDDGLDGFLRAYLRDLDDDDADAERPTPEQRAAFFAHIGVADPARPAIALDLLRAGLYRRSRAALDIMSEEEAVAHAPAFREAAAPRASRVEVVTSEDGGTVVDAEVEPSEDGTALWLCLLLTQRAPAEAPVHIRYRLVDVEADDEVIDKGTIALAWTGRAWEGRARLQVAKSHAHPVLRLFVQPEPAP